MKEVQAMERLVIEVPNAQIKNDIHKIAKKENKTVKDLLVEILQGFIEQKKIK